jgi:N-carbamoyl-L-amino-acid hydrolase
MKDLLLQINGPRLWQSLMDMAKIGATPRGGVRRLALTEDDQRGRDLFAQWCRAANLSVSIDQVGNLFARRAGTDPHAAPVLIGSHLDTQPEGGRFDGVYGVLAALELVRTLNDASITTEKPIEIVSWTNEEGARFTPAMLGSAVFTGATPLADALAKQDAQNITLADALTATGYRGTRATGTPAHAGTTPMPYRKDALFAAAQIALELERIAANYAPRGLTTIGQIGIPNASRNTIAAQVSFTVDLRHHDDNEVDKMTQDLRDACSRIAAERGVQASVDTYWRSPATPFDRDCVALVQHAADALGYTNERIVSGAGHDAILLARHCPTAMVFIPCVGGLSHNEAEDALPDDVAQGANVLLNAVLARAGVAVTANAQ